MHYCKHRQTENGTIEIVRDHENGDHRWRSLRVTGVHDDELRPDLTNAQ